MVHFINEVDIVLIKCLFDTQIPTLDICWSSKCKKSIPLALMYFLGQKGFFNYYLDIKAHPFLSLGYLELVHEGSVLEFEQVSRVSSGAYLCIASNSIPPSVSKRIVLKVECK